MADIFSERDRVLSQELFKQFGKGVAVTKSYIRQSFEIKDNQSTYEFDLGAGNPNQPLPQLLLKLIDLFVANRIAFYLEKVDITKVGNGVLQTYPNPQIFGAQAPDLETAYNGSVQISVNQTILYNNLDTHRFRFIPQTQQSATIANSEQNHTDPFIELEPNIKFSGDQSNKVTLTIPSFAGINIESKTAGIKYFLVMYLNGFLVPNGARLIGGK